MEKKPVTQNDRIRQAVLAMPMAQTLQLAFEELGDGRSTLRMPMLDAFSFRPGQLQATAIYALADFAGGTAAASLLPLGGINATIDSTLKIVAPARGSHLRARGHIVDAGRLLSVCAAEVYAVGADQETLCATLLGTMRNMELQPPR